MTINPIPTTAGVSVEYIPAPQNVERYRKAKMESIEAMVRESIALEDKRKSEEARANEGKPDALRRSLPASDQQRLLDQQIKDQRDFMERNIATMIEMYPKPMKFFLKVPTSIEREQINGRFLQLGLTRVTQEVMRATMIEELFEQDWGKGSPEANEAEAESIANFLDGFWQREEAHNAAIARWQEQEVERVLDEAEGAPMRAREELPPKIITVRENAKMQLLIGRMSKQSERMRGLMAEADDFARRNAMILVRAHVVGAENVAIELAQDPRTMALPESQVEALRELMDDASWLDLVSRIDSMYKLDGYEEKNFDSPPVKLSGQTGSEERSGDIGTSGGSLTTSSIAPVPEEGSAKIIELSSASISANAREHQSPAANSLPTDEA